MTSADANLSSRRVCSGLVRKILLVALIAWLSWAVGTPLLAQERPEDTPAREVMRLVQDASRALQARSATSFLRLFDRENFAGYPELESHIVALTTQSDIASSVETVSIEQSGAGYRLRVDWLLQLSVLETPGPLETRREVLEISAADLNNESEQKKGKWRITSLKPLEFFRPQGALPPNSRRR